MHLLFYLAEMAPIEAIGGLFWLSYNYPNSIFRQIVFRFGIWLGFLAIVTMFGFIVLNMQHFIPNGIPLDTDDGMKASVLYLSQDEGYSNSGDVIQNRTYGHNLTLKVENNTNVNVNNVAVQIRIFECETKPKSMVGPKEPENCVYNESHDDVSFGDLVFPKHSTRIFNMRSFADPTNLSSGKYPYMFFRTNVIGSSQIHSYDTSDTEEFRK